MQNGTWNRARDDIAEVPTYLDLIASSYIIKGLQHAIYISF